MTNLESVLPLDDEALRRLLYSVVEFEKISWAQDQSLKSLEQKAAWDNEARKRLDELKRELQRNESIYNGEVIRLRKYADDTRVKEYIKKKLSEGGWQERIKIVKLLVILGTDDAVEILRDISLHDPFCSEESTAPDYYTDPDVIDMFPKREIWDVRDAANRGLSKLGKQ